MHFSETSIFAPYGLFLETGRATTSQNPNANIYSVPRIVVLKIQKDDPTTRT